jgi:hypothetical protein
MLQRAEALPEVREARAGRARTYARAFLKGADRWQVAVYEVTPGQPDEEIAQVVLDDRSGAALEVWTGIQVAWTMARGYPGAFGRKASAAYVWIPLLVLFVLPFLRPPWRALHADLLAIAALSVSYAFFNAGRIEWSVPLAYPPLLYLLVRALWIARSRARRLAARDPAPPLRLLVGRDVLAFGAIFLLGFRLGLNLTASNVIDVGYAGVVGADRLLAADPLYGNFPDDIPHGDTYGPVAYYAYLPFVALLGWGGGWDELPAAHGAAIAFDLLAIAGLGLLGRRIAGDGLGLLLAYLWLACPWTMLVSNTNANDTLVAVLVLATLLVAGRPAARGAVLAAAGLVKFAPLALAPLIATYDHAAGRARWRPAGRSAAGLLAAAVALLAPVALLEGGLGTMVERTVAFQLGRDSPFSVWGLWDLGPLQTLVQVSAAVLAVVVAFVPGRRDVVSLAALIGAVLIAAQLGVAHWFYLYVVWFLAPLLVAVVGQHGDPFEPRRLSDA